MNGKRGTVADKTPETSTPITPAPSTSFKSYSVNVTASDLRIRTNAGTNYAFNEYTGKGTFTIVEEKKDAAGQGWGKLKSGAGWIALWADCVNPPTYLIQAKSSL